MDRLPPLPLPDEEADLERRFGGLRRLYGDAAYRHLRAAHVLIVGVGGVGSWAAEALARSGLATLTLIDLDHVAESNINRQVQALSSTLGQAKVQALAERIAQIHPGCRVRTVEDFITPENWAVRLAEAGTVDAVIDACDQRAAKLTLACSARAGGPPLILVGAAGGKRQPARVELADLADTSHDPLLASLRQQLRQRHGAPRKGPLGLRCVFSREPVQHPQDEGACASDGSLNCHGYGSSVGVTATFGLVAASAAIDVLLAARHDP